MRTQSGSTPCACRDCMDSAISSDVTSPDLCWHCEESGCESYAWYGVDEPVGTSYECQREDVYA